MGGGLKERAITSESGFIAQVNQSGQLAVETVVNVGAVTVGVSGEVVRIVGINVSGEFSNIYVTTSGMGLSGIPHKLVVGFSGDSVFAAISGQPVVAEISGQPVIAKISGETINIQGGVTISGNVVNITDQRVRISGDAVSVSGQNVNITSGQVQVTSGIVVSKISGETITVGNTVTVGGSVTVAGTVSVTSGTGVRISGETVSIAGGVSVSGNAVNASGNVVRISEESGRGTAELKAYDFSGQSWRAVGIDISGGSSLKIAGSFTANVSGQPVNVSGSTVYLVSGQNGTQLYAYDASGQVLRDLWVKESGSHVLRVDTVTTVDISGATISAGISGQTLYIVSGQNTVQLTSGYNIVRISGDTVIAKTSGDIARIPGSESGYGSAEIKAYDPSGQTWNDIWVNNSGQHRLLVSLPSPQAVNVSGNIVNISGNAVSISGESVVVTSGQVQILSGVVTISGNVVSVSGGVVKVSGEVIRISEESGRATAQLFAYDLSGLSWRPIGVDVSGGSSLKIAGSFSASISGQPVNVTSGQVQVMSGILVALTSGQSNVITSGTVTISGQNVNVTSGQFQLLSGKVEITSGSILAKTSGETNRLSFLEVSGTFVNPYVTQSGKGISGIPHKLVVALSGDPVTVSGNVVITSVSGNVLSVSVSGNVITVLSGTGVRVSGETISLTSGAGVRISGEVVYANNSVSGNTPIGSITSLSGVALLTADAVRSEFRAFATLVCTAASGGTQLLSGVSRSVSIQNIGQSGTIMFVGSSGTSRAPWVATEFSGFGWQLKDGNSVVIGAVNPDRIRVVSLTSGQPISYAVNDY